MRVLGSLLAGSESLFQNEGLVLKSLAYQEFVCSMINFCEGLIRPETTAKTL